MPAIKHTNAVKKVTKGLIGYLQKSRQLNLLSQVAAETLKASRHQLDPNLAIVQSVIPLSETQISSLQTILSASLNRPITVQNQINPQIIGGISVKIGDRRIDQSLDAKINQLAQRVNL